VKLSFRTATVCLLAWALQCGLAAAAEGWLDKLSGPGPFAAEWGRGPYTVRLVCWRESGGLEFEAAILQGGECVKPLRSGRAVTPSDLRAYVQLSYTHWISTRNDLFRDVTRADEELHRVKLDSTELTFFVHAGRAIDVGVGVGIEVFSGNAFDTFRRVSVKPLDVTLTPIAAVTDSKWGRLVAVTVNTRAFTEELTERDFCRDQFCRGIRSFSSEGEYTWSAAVTVNAGVIITSIAGH
jgi:hypothetical protein